MVRCGLAGQFIAVITPENCDARGPDSRIFLSAIEILGVWANKGFMVGDSFAVDIEPALALGMGAFHIDADAKCRSLYGVNSL